MNIFICKKLIINKINCKYIIFFYLHCCNIFIPSIAEFATDIRKKIIKMKKNQNKSKKIDSLNMDNQLYSTTKIRTDSIKNQQKTSIFKPLKPKNIDISDCNHQITDEKNIISIVYQESTNYQFRSLFDIQNIHIFNNKRENQIYNHNTIISFIKQQTHTSHSIELLNQYLRQYRKQIYSDAQTQLEIFELLRNQSQLIKISSNLMLLRSIINIPLLFKECKINTFKNCSIDFALLDQLASEEYIIEKHPFISSCEKYCNESLSGSHDKKVPLHLKAFIDQKRKNLFNRVHECIKETQKKKLLFGSEKLYNLVEKYKHTVEIDQLQYKIENTNNSQIVSLDFKIINLLMKITPSIIKYTIPYLIPNFQLNVPYLICLNKILKSVGKKMQRSILYQICDNLIDNTIDLDLIDHNSLDNKKIIFRGLSMDKLNELKDKNLQILIKLVKKSDKNILAYSLNDLLIRNQIIEKYIKTGKSRKIYKLLKKSDNYSINHENAEVLIAKIIDRIKLTQKSVKLLTYCFKYSERTFLNRKIDKNYLIEILKTEKNAHTLLKFMKSIVIHEYRDLDVLKLIFFKNLEIFIPQFNQENGSNSLKDNKSYKLFAIYHKTMRGKFYLCIAEIFTIIKSNTYWSENEKDTTRWIIKCLES